jgi:hypothetical protein
MLTPSNRTPTATLAKPEEKVNDLNASVDNFLPDSVYKFNSAKVFTKNWE